MDAAWARGVRRFDTASSYGGGHSEQTIGAWVRARQPPGSQGDEQGLPSRACGRRRRPRAARVRRVAHESRERLGVERIDVYLIHEPDPATPLAATLAALEELVRDGVVGAIGVSNVDAAFLAEAIRLAPIAVVQNEYSLLVRDAEDDVLPLCAEHGIEFQAFSPLAGGWLTGKYARDAAYPRARG